MQINSLNEILRELTFLDTKSGISYCLNNKQLYISVLRDYLSIDKKDSLLSALKNENWCAYKIHLHSIKNSAKTIGATQIFKEFSTLEYALQKKEYEFLKKHTPRVMLIYDEIRYCLSEILCSYNNIEETQILSSPKKHTVLIIDDDTLMLRIISRIFSKDYNVLLASSDEDVLSILNQNIPDIILMDIFIPDIMSNETNHRLSMIVEEKYIPILLLVPDSNIPITLPDDVVDYIKKPIDIRVARQRVQHTIDLYRLQRHLKNEIEIQTKEIVKRSEKIKRISLQLVLSLANAIEAKDPYTKGHSKRVAEYACMIAEKLGYTEEELLQLHYIGLLHDIGKIGVPDTIISSPNPLTDEEYEQIKQHPNIGAMILKDVTEIPNITLGAKWHHERFDGRGYPDGLKGYDIPEVARIIGIADAYDAMTSNRKYRSGLPQDVVREEIRRGIGTQFDPHIAEIMLEIIDKDKNFLLRELPSQK